jgi:hypothetical protein
MATGDLAEAVRHDPQPDLDRFEEDVVLRVSGQKHPTGFVRTRGQWLARQLMSIELVFTLLQGRAARVNPVRADLDLL